MASANRASDAEMGKALEKSFKEFTLRPENKALVQAAQREEAQQALDVHEAETFSRFMSAVEQEGPDVISAVAPFARSPVLRRIMLSFANGSDQGGIAAWACNGQVQALLRRAQKLLASKRMSEEELEYLVLEQLRSPGNPDRERFLAVSKPAAVVAAHQLADALNEHLAERRAGARALQAQQADVAAAHFERALSILKLVRGGNAEDQELIQDNTVATLLELAHAQLTAQAFGAAVASCKEVLGLAAADGARAEQRLRALVLLARAHAWRREYQEAQQALQQVRTAAARYSQGEEQQQEDEDEDEEVQDIVNLMLLLHQEDKAHEAAFCSRMFGASKKQQAPHSRHQQQP